MKTIERHYKHKLSALLLAGACVLAVQSTVAGGIDPRYRANDAGTAAQNKGRVSEIINRKPVAGSLQYGANYERSNLPTVANLRDMSLEELDAYIHELDYSSYAGAITLDALAPYDAARAAEIRTQINTPRIYRTPEEKAADRRASEVNVATQLLNELPLPVPIPLPPLDSGPSNVKAGDGNDYGVSLNKNELNDKLQRWVQGVTVESIPDAAEPEAIIADDINIVREAESTTTFAESGEIAMSVYSTDDQPTPAELSEGQAPAANTVFEGDAESTLSMDVRVNSNQLLLDLRAAYDALKAGQYESATALYKRVLRKEPNHVDALFGLASVYQRSQQYAQAKALYLQVLDREPQHEGAINNLMLVMSQTNPAQSLNDLKTIAKANPESADVPAQIAAIYLRKGEYENAAKYMHRAMQLEPANLKYRHYLALLLEELKQYDVAKSMYREMIEYHYATRTPLPEPLVTIQRRLENLELLSQQTVQR